jgi:hypothetical protein
MRASIDTRLAKLEAVARPQSAVRQPVFVVQQGEDCDAYLRDRGITLGPDDEPLWIELVPVWPRPRN